jgi:hypothetical protein
MNGRPDKTRSRLLVAQTIVFVLLVCLAAASTPGYADLRPPARPRGEPPMRFVRVVGSNPSCAPDCPEWLSAEGRIEPGSATAFADALKRLHGRRLPILIHSLGGSVADAIAMGRLIRAQGLAVAVARSLIANCSEGAATCKDGPGQAITGGAACASACVLVLAGGVERLVGPAARVGVHQITTVVKETNGLSHLTSTHKFYEQPKADTFVNDYLALMGIGDPAMDLLRKTPAASIRWLDMPELRASRLATMGLDAVEPMLSSGANGLNGRGFEGDPPSVDLFVAQGSEPLVPAIGQRGTTLDITFRYRRGGGAIEAEVTTRDSNSRKATGEPFAGWTFALAAESVEPERVTTGSSPTHLIIARERFCALRHGGRLIVTPPAPSSSGAGAGSQLPIIFELAEIEARAAIFDEACPRETL